MRQVLRSLWALLLPPRCGVCDTALPAVGSGVCGACWAQVVRNDGQRCASCDLPGESPCTRCRTAPPSYAGLRAPFVYGGPIASLVVRTKFSRREDLALVLGRLLAERAPAGAGLTAVVPVPLGRRRRRQRGFNQSAVLARTVAHELEVPLVHALRRLRETAPQSELPLHERESNVRRAFVAARPLSGEVLLVDDVVTSGHTIEAAARALREGGAASVRVLALARAVL